MSFYLNRYGPIPYATALLVRMLKLKLVSKHGIFSCIKPEGKQHVVMETPMEEPAWKKLSESLPSHLKTRFVYSGGKVVVRGLGVLKPEKQLESLTEWLGYLQGAIAEPLAS